MKCLRFHPLRKIIVKKLHWEQNSKFKRLNLWINYSIIDWINKMKIWTLTYLNKRKRATEWILRKYLSRHRFHTLSAIARPVSKVWLILTLIKRQLKRIWKFKVMLKKIHVQIKMKKLSRIKIVKIFRKKTKVTIR